MDKRIYRKLTALLKELDQYIWELHKEARSMEKKRIPSYLKRFRKQIKQLETRVETRVKILRNLTKLSP